MPNVNILNSHRLIHLLRCTLFKSITGKLQTRGIIDHTWKCPNFVVFPCRCLISPDIYLLHMTHPLQCIHQYYRCGPSWTTILFVCSLQLLVNDILSHLNLNYLACYIMQVLQSLFLKYLLVYCGR